MGCLVEHTVAGQSFTFGARSGSGRTVVDTGARYRADTGYGFDLGSLVQMMARPGADPFVTGRQAFYFSVAVPQEGNYRVTVTLGDTEGRSLTTVKAESRRLMLFRIATRTGEIKRLSFIVNIRKPQISTGGQVSLKPRETGRLDWDDKLTLEFSDERPCVRAIEIARTDTPVTVYLAGNSTVVNQEQEPWAAWGQMIPAFFGPDVAIANHAESGLSLGSFLASRRLDKILSVLRRGDYVFIEFGHNDQKETGPADGAYQSYTERLRHFITVIPGAGWPARTGYVDGPPVVRPDG